MIGYGRIPTDSSNNFNPKISLKEGLKRTYDYYKNNLESEEL